MIVFDRKEKEIKVPEGLGNINLTVVDANLEDKTVEINEVETTILPSSGYNGMSSLQIDAQPVYDNGYNEGENIGYNSGYTAGEVEQKSKLTNITISENGTYTREDGYNTVVVNVEDTNGSYDEGYQAGIEEGTANAGEIIGETARVLNITENGIYTSEYSQWGDYQKPEQVTGVFDDGKEFYNEAYPQGIVYRTNDFTITPQTKVELWLKPVNYTWTTDYFSLDVREQGDEFRLRVNGSGSIKSSFLAKIGDSSVYIDLTELEYKKMHHIVMSFVDGFWLDGVKVADFEGNFTIGNLPYSFEINPNAINIGSAANYGMFKIDDVVIIPTEDGFLNVNTNELLTYTNVSTQPQYTYYNNFTEPIAEGNLIRTVNVDVHPKINVERYSINLGYSNFSEIPEMFDFSKVTNMTNMFRNCGNLETISLINTSNVVTMSSMFQDCIKLQTLPELDTSNVTDMSNMFQNCGNLQTIPLINTSNVVTMSSMFQDCIKLQTLPELDTSNVIHMGSMFRRYGGIQTLTSLPKFNVPKVTDITGYFYYSKVTMNNLTEVGGWENLKCNWNDDSGLACLPNLTYQSCINILNGLYDFVLNGETPTSSQGKLKVHSNFLTTVGDEISIGTNKGWTITA